MLHALFILVARCKRERDNAVSRYWGSRLGGHNWEGLKGDCWLYFRQLTKRALYDPLDRMKAKHFRTRTAPETIQYTYVLQITHDRHVQTDFDTFIKGSLDTEDETPQTGGPADHTSQLRSP